MRCLRPPLSVCERKRYCYIMSERKFSLYYGVKKETITYLTIVMYKWKEDSVGL